MEGKIAPHQTMGYATARSPSHRNNHPPISRASVPEPASISQRACQVPEWKPKGQPEAARTLQVYPAWRRGRRLQELGWQTQTKPSRSILWTPGSSPCGPWGICLRWAEWSLWRIGGGRMRAGTQWWMSSTHRWMSSTQWWMLLLDRGNACGLWAGCSRRCVMETTSCFVMVLVRYPDRTESIVLVVVRVVRDIDSGRFTKFVEIQRLLKLKSFQELRDEATVAWGH